MNAPSAAAPPLPPVFDTPEGERLLLALVDIVRGLAAGPAAGPAAPPPPAAPAPDETQEVTS